MTVLNILRHFKCFYNILSHCLWLKYCSVCLIWIANGQNLHFVQKYLCFILLRGDQNICGWETDEKLTRLCSSSMDVLPSKSLSRVTWLKTINRLGMHRYKYVHTLRMFCLLHECFCIIWVALKYKSQHVSDEKKHNFYFWKYHS